MARINRTYSIEEFNVERLKKIDNASGLINDLLEKHFNKKSPKDIDNLKKELNIMESEIIFKQNERDNKAEIIKQLETQVLMDNKEREHQEQEQNNQRVNIKWLSEQVKQKIITFDEYRKIKALFNYDDVIEEMKSGKLQITKVIESIEKNASNKLDKEIEND